MNVMTAMTGSTASSSAPPGPARFTAAEFWRIVESDAFGDIRVELVGGELHRVPPPGRSHGQAQRAILLRLGRLLPEDRLIGEVAIDVGDDTVLGCDVVILRAGDGTSPVVAAAELLLAVEIAVSTLDRDLGLKRRLYAAAGIPTYWVVDAERALVHVFDRPEGGDYRGLALVRFGEPLAIPGTDGAVTLA